MLLEELDARRKIGVDGLVATPRGIHVAGEGVAWLVACLIQDAQVGPGCCVSLVVLNCTDVCLKGINRLVLLLVQDSAGGLLCYKWGG